MSDQHVPKPDGAGAAPAWVWLFLLGGTAAFLASYWALARVAKHLQWHALIGDSLAPVAALLSLFAVVAALWSVHVQREELRDNRSVLKEHAAQFERTAKAQEALAASQERLAVAQERANVVGLAGVEAQHRQITVGLVSVTTQVLAQVEELKAREPPLGRAFEVAVAPPLQLLRNLLIRNKDWFLKTGKALGIQDEPAREAGRGSGRARQAPTGGIDDWNAILEVVDASYGGSAMRLAVTQLRFEGAEIVESDQGSFLKLRLGRPRGMSDAIVSFVHGAAHDVFGPTLIEWERE